MLISLNAIVMILNLDSESKEINCEKIERFSFRVAEKIENDINEAEYDPFEHRKIEHPIT